jgi:hypothetical protein
MADPGPTASAPDGPVSVLRTVVANVTTLLKSGHSRHVRAGVPTKSYVKRLVFATQAIVRLICGKSARGDVSDLALTYASQDATWFFCRSPIARAIRAASWRKGWRRDACKRVAQRERR